MKTVKVNLGKRSYNIYIGEGVLEKLRDLPRLPAPETPVFIVTNRKIKNLHGRRLEKSLKRFGKKILFHEVPDSEKAKSFSVYIKAVSALARFSKKTKPLVIAFGGGVVGDLTGFVAATYRRGVPYINVPTTLLSQVDSAIGGKVALDIKNAKNIVGDFYQPKMVLCDLRFLKTLPEHELRNGLVETIKYGIIKERGLFFFIDKNLKHILKLDSGAIEHVIFRSCAIKARIVEKDEFDTKGVRAILNFGHTLGHAIEAAFLYSKSAAHGRAVAAGMVMASFIALESDMLKRGEYETITSLIKKVSLKIKIDPASSMGILGALPYDKKFIHGVNRFILPKKIGRAVIVDNVPQGLIKKAIKEISHNGGLYYGSEGI